MVANLIQKKQHILELTKDSELLQWYIIIEMTVFLFWLKFNILLEINLI